MENNRLKKYSRTFCKWYLILSHILFVIWQILLWISYVSDDNLREYCIHVPVESGNKYHFQVSPSNACLIDWMYFVKEPLFISAIIYFILCLPILFLWLFLRKK